MAVNKISDLAAVVPPPPVPLDWSEDALECNKQTLFTDFPSDVQEFGKLFGSGTFETPSSWEVWSPARKTYPLLVMHVSRILNIYKSAMEVTDVPFGIFPEPGGILPFASTPDGDWVGWLTEGAPDDWRVVDLSTYERGAFEIFEMGFSEYFLNVLTRRIVLARQRRSKPWTSEDIRFQQEIHMDQSLYVEGAV